MVLNVHITTNQSFEWIDVIPDGVWEPSAEENVVDMGTRGIAQKSRSDVIGKHSRQTCVCNAAFSPSSSGPEAGKGISADRYTLKVKKAPALQEKLFSTRYAFSCRRIGSATCWHRRILLSLSHQQGLQQRFNAGWSASGMNPNFFKLMPEIQDDSYATIGLRTGARISGITGAEDPTMVQDAGA